MNREPFVVEEYVRWSDVDYAGIIFYGAYLRFFEIGETELFRAAGVPYGDVFDRFDMWLPRVHLECDFKYPARLDDQLRVAAYFTAFGTSSITIAFDVFHVSAQRLAATGQVVLVCTSRKHLRPQPLPNALLELLAPYKLSTSDVRHFLGAEDGA